MVSSHFPTSPVIGLIGGGQLARMLAQAAAQLGCSTAVLDPDEHAPALGVCTHPVVGDWRDPQVLLDFAAKADVVTVENEFVDAVSLARLEEAGAHVHPGSATMAVVQDKLTQRQTLRRHGLPVPNFRSVGTPGDVTATGADFGWPLMLKRRRDGYDGNGNATLKSPADVAAAWERLGADKSPAYAEAFCPFESELAVMVCRSRTGDTVTYPVVRTVQQNHICHVVQAPAPIPPEIATAAAQLACRAIEAVNGVGCFGVELFLLRGGELMINELAPRVHNSGHYTIEACGCSQFENHLRAIMGWPLGSTAMRSPAAAMVNLLGHGPGPGHPAGLEQALRVPGAHIHVYGKRESRPGRKMGHITALGTDIDSALAIAATATNALRFGNS